MNPRGERESNGEFEAAKAPDRLTLSLAERLYHAHLQWTYDLAESSVWPRWFAVRDDIKVVYIEVADALLKSEDKRKEAQQA